MTRSDVGTPLSQTLKTRSSVHEKLSKLRMGGAEETAKRAQEKLYTLFESDNGLLKCGSGRPPCSEASYEDPETEKDTATKQIPNSAIESGNLLGDGSRRRFSDPLINLPQRSHFNGVQPAGRLPLLERKEWVPIQPRHRCRTGDSPRACCYAVQDRCRFWHVQLPLRHNLLEADSIKPRIVGLNPLNVRLLERQGVFSAAYVDHRQKRIFYAEGGQSSQRSNQGVYWYRTENEARSALEHVAAMYRSLNS
jgi:hypothetical protein